MMGILARIVCLSILVVILFTPTAFAADKSAIKHVLVLFLQDGWAVPAYRMVYEGMNATFSADSKYNINLFSENLDLSFFSGESDQRRLAEFLDSKYTRNHIDVIVPVTFPVMQFIQRYRETFLPGVPVVYSLLNVDDLEQIKHEPDITGVALKLEISDTIKVAQRLHPGLKRLAVVTGTGPTDRYLVSLTRQAFDDFEGQLEWIDLTGLPLKELLLQVSRLPQSTAILFLTLQQDGEGNNFVSAEIQRTVSESANAPLYNFIDSAFGYGSVGGRMTSIEANGRKAGELVLRVLNGEKAGAIEPVVLSDNPYMFDWHQMTRWGIKESALPPNSIVRFKERNLLIRYRGWIIAALVLVIFQASLVAVLLLTLRRRKRVQNDLARSQTNLRRAQEIAQIGSFRFDIQKDEVVWSLGAREIYGVSFDRKIDYAFFLSMVHPDDRQFVDRSWKNALKGGGYDIEHRIVIANKIKWVREKVDFDFNKYGKPMSGTGIVLDISQRKKLETESSTLHRELTHVGRLSVVGELSQSLAHEINQPLAAILANAEATIHLLAKDKPDIMEIHEALVDIVDDNKRAQAIIQRIRGLVKKASHNRSLVDINTVAKVCVKLVEGHARGRMVNVFLSLTPDSTIVKADTIQLQQVVLNLLVNAMEAMEESCNGRKFVTLSTNRLDKGVIQLCVRDSGTGIDPQTVKRLFEPFFTTKKNGLGLGLSISRSIVESHGGSVAFESSPGQGTTFTIELPASEAQPSE